MRKLAIVLCLLATTVISEVHWGVMQSVTWVVMIQSADPDAGLARTVISTLSGEAPCQHCEALMEERQSQRDEVLSQLAQGPQIVPIRAESPTPGRENYLLFSLSEPGSLPPLAGVDPPTPPPEA